METLTFDLDNYTVTLLLSRGTEIDAVAVLAQIGRAHV